MLALALQKLISKGWLTSCLCCGLIAAVALVTSIPIYTEGALQRVLRQDMIDYREKRNSYPGGFVITKNFTTARNSVDLFKDLPDYETEIERRLLDGIPLPLLVSTSRLDLKSIFVSDGRIEGKSIRPRTTRISSLPGIERHVVLVAGEFPSPHKTDETYEVMIHEEAMEKMDFLLGKTYEILDMQFEPVFSVRVSGVFRINPASQAFWHSNLQNLDNAFFISPSQFTTIVSSELSQWAVDAKWYYGFDVSMIDTAECESLKKKLVSQAEFFSTIEAFTKIPLLNIIDVYLVKRENLTTLLLFMIVPALIIAEYFVFMLVELIMESEANDIALLQSRGSRRGQIVALYYLMFSLPSLVALLIGPFAGRGAARIIGAADGFLKFGNTEGFASTINLRIWLYAVAAVIICFATILIPIIRSSGTTIVLHKAKVARPGRRWIWRGLVPAGVLISVAMYALYSYRMRQQILMITSVQGIELPMDPLYFIAVSFFIFGSGMLCLRALPVSVLLLFRFTGRMLPTVLYTSLLQVGRSFNRERYAFMFLVLTVAGGIFYSNAARTLNLSTEHRIRYENGADVRLIPRTSPIRRNQSTGIVATPTRTDGPLGEDQGGAQLSADFIKFIAAKNKLFDIYPSLRNIRSIRASGTRRISDYEMVDGVESATMIAKIPEAVLVAPTGRREDIAIIAVEPARFANASWYRNDLNEYTLLSYLEALARYPDHVFASPGILERYDNHLQKPFSIHVPGSSFFDVYVLDEIRFWPALNPAELFTDDREFIICNLNYLDAMVPLTQTEVWLERDMSVDNIDFYSSLLRNGFDFIEIGDAGEEIYKRAVAPQFAGFNGTLSLSFIATVAASLLGFVACWVVSLHERQLQFGIFRSLGMPVRSVVGILISEQFFVSGSAILSGTAIGSLVSRLFLPLLGLTAGASEQVPTVQIGAFESDYYLVISIVGIMLVLAFIYLGAFVSKMKIHQALKLGEE
jgi:putative ABC transport system permease protein